MWDMLSCKGYPYYIRGFINVLTSRMCPLVFTGRQKYLDWTSLSEKLAFKIILTGDQFAWYLALNETPITIIESKPLVSQSLNLYLATLRSTKKRVNFNSQINKAAIHLIAFTGLKCSFTCCTENMGEHCFHCGLHACRCTVDARR